MGSDLYMEEQSWRARPNKARWDGDDLIVEQDRFYHGYVEVWRGKVTPETKPVLEAFGVKIPAKPGTLGSYTLDFQYIDHGRVSAKLSLSKYSTPEKIEARLRLIALEEYDLRESQITHVVVKKSADE